MQTIGDRIKIKRKELHLTQSELAKKLNVTDKAVSKWEQNEGNPDFSLLTNISDALNVSLDYLIAGKENDSITIDDMDDSKRMHYLIKRDDASNFNKYGYARIRFNGNVNNSIFIHNSESRTVLNYILWNEIIDNNAISIFNLCLDSLLESKFAFDYSFLISGISNEFVRMAYDLDRVDVFDKINIRYFAIGENVDRTYNYGRYHLELSKIGKNYCFSCGCINTETIDYIFKNAIKSPDCFEYFTTPVIFNYDSRKFFPITYLESHLVDYAIKYDCFNVVNKMLNAYKKYEELCVFKFKGLMHKNYDIINNYIYDYLDEPPMGKIMHFTKNQIKGLIDKNKLDLVNECIEFNKSVISMLNDIYNQKNGNYGIADDANNL